MGHGAGSALRLVVLAAACAAAGSALAGNSGSAGIDLRTEAADVDVGLPVYPGATPQVDDANDKSALGFSAWAGVFGFRLAVLKLASRDGVEPVAAFYRQALARYGTVLDCSPPRRAPSPPPAPAPADPNALRCDGDDKAPAGTRIFKAGTKRQFRQVSIQPVAGGTHFQLVSVNAAAD